MQKRAVITRAIYRMQICAERPSECYLTAIPFAERQKMQTID